MSLREAAIASRRQHGPKCSVGLFLAGLPDEDCAEMLDVLNDPRIPVSATVRTIADLHPDASVPAYHCWGHHLRGACSCG